MPRIDRTSAAALSIALLAFAIPGRTFAAPPAASAPSPAFLAADVHVSPYRRTPDVRVTFAGQLYTLRDATMANLITVAYAQDQKYILGGPTWLEWNRYDVFAKLPPNSPPGALALMLRTLLANRFQLVTHPDTRPLPAFVLTAEPGKLKLKKAAASDDSGCQGKPQNPAPGTVPRIALTCHNMTMEDFARFLRGFSATHLAYAVVDSTNLAGAWDFDLNFTEKNRLVAAGADALPLSDALDKQLGLALTPGIAPIPVLVVDSVNEKPAPNPPDTAKIMPPPTPAEFEVSIIKPGKPDAQMDGDLSGGQIKIQGITLDALIRIAWDLPKDGPMLQGAPKWLTEDKFDILAKAPREAGAPQLDEDDLLPMLRALLAERFKLVTHTEDQPLDAYNLVAANPRLEKSAPGTYTRCGQTPGPDGKDPRVTNPILNRLLTCQGITMQQFAGQIQSIVPGYIKTPVLDATGIDGAYDFTLSYSGIGKLKNGGGPPEGSPAGDAAGDPSGAISFFDALNKTLGLKLAKVKRPISVLVIDHVDEKPTEN